MEFASAHHRWYGHNQHCQSWKPPPLLEEHPLSDRCLDIMAKLPCSNADMQLTEVRSNLKLLDMKIAHSFERKGKWHSASLEELRQFYCERSMHMLGNQRLEDWASSAAEQVRQPRSPGCAVAFW